ncbi:MAG: WD40 repeat domain-containing protein [Saprospiraceae bacterium]
MSAKITKCRIAAENELFAKQQEAERQARHAIAANLADDAQELLQTNDRSLAFRLADFANQYIAPDDNSDCVQAMFDAWYYQPAEDSKNRLDELYNPVFCYELEGNLNKETQVKFVQQKDGSHLLWAFVPKVGDMFAWELPSMKLVQSYGTGENNGYLGFDFSPNGDLIFWGNKFFDLRRGSRSIRVDVPSVTRWCFSTRGDEFFFENAAEQKISVLNLREAFVQQNLRKGAKGSNIVQAPVLPREIVTGVPDSLLAMEYYEAKFWLGFQDRVEVLVKTAPGKPWTREKIIRFEGVTIPEFSGEKGMQLTLFPKEGFATLCCLQGTWSIPLNLKAENTAAKPKVRAYDSMYPIAVSAATHQIACLNFSNYRFNGFWIIDALTGDTILRQRIPYFTGYNVLEGNFSADGQWAAALSYTGNLNVWALQDAPTKSAVFLPDIADDKPIFSPEGSRLFVTYADTLSIFNISAPQKEPRNWKNIGQPLQGVSDHWAIIQVSVDSAEARHLADDRALRFPLKNDDATLLYAIDSKGERLMAYLKDWNTVEVRSLKTGALLASRVFEGGAVGALNFIPGTDNLLVVHHSAAGENVNSESNVKLWSPLRTGENPKVFRLDDYPVLSVAVDQSGSKAAFSNGNDIRIFDLKNIENEVLKIRATTEEYVQAIAFRANSNLLAAAYSSGKIVFWNDTTGQASLKLQAVPEEDLFESGKRINAIGFSDQGTVLQISVTDGQLLSYILDPSIIRAIAQDDNRQLQSFDAEHILQYNLEASLYYPGNFERLAESGDAPLIRSFFKYFREQAIGSNNIEQVRDYCERAFYLYERLDKTSKDLWQIDMNMMYGDYARKLLLRGNINEAIAVISFIKQEFDKESVLLNAHIALLKRDFTKASALYSKSILMSEDDVLPLPFGLQYQFGYVELDIMKLRDYELIDSTQINCFCGTISLSGALSNLCPLGKNYNSDFLSYTDRTHWEIAEIRNAASKTLRLADQTQFLETTHQKAKSLVRQGQPKEQVWLELVTLELATTHVKRAIFELNSPDAYTYFEKSVQLLTEIDEFKIISDSSRLSTLSATRLAWGKQLLAAGKLPEALAQFNLGLVSAQMLSEVVSRSDTSLLTIYYDNLVGPLYEKLGTTYLLLGQPGEAKQAYEQSSNFYVTYGLSTLYRASVAVFENDENQAFLDYGGIKDPNEAAEALFVLSRLGERFPDRSAQIEGFATRLRNALKATNPRLINAETDYWFAKFKADHFAAQTQWDSAIVWNTLALAAAKKCMEQPYASEYWTLAWLNEHINVPYYLLLGRWNKPAALTECIRYVESADAYIEKQDPTNFYFGNKGLLKPNLAHALSLRNSPGDRDQAIELYKEFFNNYVDFRGYDNLDLLQKGVRDLKRLGAPIPELPEFDEKGVDE